MVGSPKKIFSAKTIAIIFSGLAVCSLLVMPVPFNYILTVAFLGPVAAYILMKKGGNWARAPITYKHKKDLV